MTRVTPPTMKTLRLHTYGEPADVLRLEEAVVPSPGAGRVRVQVHACALNPADWALCRGFFPGAPPRGIGLDVSGTVDAVGEGVADVSTGDLVFGVPDFMGYPSAGASDYAVLAVWVPVPKGLDLIEAAALPMAVETAVRGLDRLGVAAGQTVLISGAGTMTGFAAVQVALLRGARVVATAGETFADRLRDLGASVTSYGDGMVDRVRKIAGGAPDLVLHTVEAPGGLPDLINIVDGDPGRIVTITDFEEAARLGVRSSGREENVVLHYDALGHFAQLAAEGRFTVPVARRFTLEDWRTAMDLSLSRQAHGKLVLLPDRARH